MEPSGFYITLSALNIKVALPGRPTQAGNHCEYYVSQVAETIRLNAVHYDLENWKGLTASKCALFCCLNSGNSKSGKPYRLTIGHYRIIGNHRYRTPLTEIVQAIYRRNFLELRKYSFLIRFYK